jgi:maltose/moltooligosaccharide transporter
MAWVQFFSWFALCGFDGYTTHLRRRTTSEAYNTGANQVGEMFANYNFAALAAFFYYHISKIYQPKIHFIALVCGGTWSYIHLFHTRTNSLHYGWLPMIGC